MLCVRVQQTPIHDHVPEAAVDCVDRRENDKDRLVLRTVVETVQAECHVVEDRAHVFAAVDQMRKGVACVFVPAETLKGAPNTRQSCEESQES